MDRVDEDHHHDGPHGFSGVGVDMVSRFPLDSMRLACLGVTRRLLNVWLRGPLKFCLSSNLVDRISHSLIPMHAYIPAEFERKPRSLRELDRRKATELRQFLLNTGSVFWIVIYITTLCYFIQVFASLSVLSCVLCMWTLTTLLHRFTGWGCKRNQNRNIQLNKCSSTVMMS